MRSAFSVLRLSAHTALVLLALAAAPALAQPLPSAPTPGQVDHASERAAVALDSGSLGVSDKQKCINDCKADRQSCLSGDDFPLPRICVQEYKRCIAQCK